MSGIEFTPTMQKKSLWEFFKQKVSFILSVLLIVSFSLGTILVVQFFASKITTDISPLIFSHFAQLRWEIKPDPEPPRYKFNPGPISIREMKTKGCVVDGILSDYSGKTKTMTKLINRSECVYLHRALETWVEVPDFERAEQKIMPLIVKDRVIYGMFIAEALDKKGEHFYEDKDRDFDFSRMCKDGTDNRWGEHTCIPDLDKKEYRRYVTHITQHAMDIGIQSFLFGQVYLQDSDNLSKSNISEVLEDMRDYADKIGIEIAIGAQTNDIADEKYLKLFDYIEGGVGISENGSVENGPCWSGKSSCWALLWNHQFSSKAKNVFLHLDWSGLEYDDMSKFARMDHSTRIQTLEGLYKKFTSQNMGFLMPFFATINKQNGGCYGPKKKYYTPDDKYKCKDEDEINKIMTKAIE